MTAGHYNTLLICPLTSASVRGMLAEMRRAAEIGADIVECRLDYLRKPPSREDLRGLLSGAPLGAIATCRPVRQGGRYDGDEARRLDILRAAAAAGAKYIDVEIDVPREDWPDANVILSHHDFDRCPAGLGEILQRMESSDAVVVKAAFAADGPADAFRALEFIRASRKPAIAIAMGEAGVASRILAAKFGAFGTFASLDDESASAPGQITVEEMKNLYRWDDIGAKTKICGVVGFPVAHSMSPAIHNAAFSALGLDVVYVPLLIRPGWDNFRRFMDAVIARGWLGWRGLSVTLPHKENARNYLDERSCDSLALDIGAVNTITFGGTAPRGDNTDYAAAIDCLCRSLSIGREDLASRDVAVLGAGGVARSIVAALTHYGAKVTIHNRTESRSRRLADEFNCSAGTLGDACASAAEIIVNCTSVGMSPNEDASPLAELPEGAKVVFDTIYNPIETKLLRMAKRAGMKTVSGLDMFVRQAAAQFELWTACTAPEDVMRNVAGRRLQA